MAEVANWEDQLLAAWDFHDSIPFSWADSNCLWLALDCARAVTGVDPYADERGRFKTRRGAASRLKRRGFDSVEAAIAAVYRRIAMAEAKRGDVAIVPEELLAIGGLGTCGTVLGTHIACKGLTGLVRVPALPEYRYYSVRP
jgi:hypothetical protein